MMKAVKPKKNLGQHFLTDLNIAKRIADTVDACPDIPVLKSDREWVCLRNIS